MSTDPQSPRPSQEFEKFTQPEFYEAAGNKFAILLFTDPNTSEDVINTRSAKVFEQNPGTIDTVLVLVKLADQRFRYLVIERDGSWSEMCGNGARAVAKYLYDSALAKPGQPIILVTKSGKEIGVKALEIDGDTWYQVNMGRVSSVEEDSKNFEGLLEQGFDGNLEKFDLRQLILAELDKYLKNPKLLRELFPYLNPDNTPNSLSIYGNYFHEILQRVSDKNKFAKFAKVVVHKESEFTNFVQVYEESEFTKFTNFVQALAYRGLYQAGGEPHTLIEITNPEIVTSLGDVRFSVYLKAVSFLLRHTQDQHGNRLYPQSMNFMFYVVKPKSQNDAAESTADKPTNNFEVRMFPSERGVHKETDYDQTGACGTGSCCLGNYLLRFDPRFSGLNEIEIINRSGISLIIALNGDETRLIGQAERTNRYTVEDKNSHLPFVAQIIVERFYYFNSKGEARLDQLATEAGQSPNSIIQLFSTIRGIFKENDKMLAVTSIDHPNPKGFWDFYTIVGYLMSAYIAEQLKLVLAPASLNTTETDGNDFPAELNFQSLGDVSDKFREALSKVLGNQFTIDPNKSPYQLLIEHLEKLVAADGLISNFLDTFLNSLESTTNKEDYQSRIAVLVYYLIQNKCDEPQSEDSSETQNKKDDKSKKKNVVVRECLILQALLNSMLDLEKKLNNLKAHGAKISKELLLNIFQALLKGRLIDAIYPWILYPEQIQVLQEARLLESGVNYLSPDISTSGITGDKSVLAEKLTKAISLMLEADPNLLAEYVNFYFKKNNGNSRIALAKVNNEYLLAIRTKGGGAQFYLSNKKKINPRDIKPKPPEEGRDEIEIKPLEANELNNIFHQDQFQKPENQITIYGFLYGIVLAFGQLHHFGSERGIRSFFLEFLLEKFSKSQSDLELIKKIYSSAQGLICPDYVPEDYEKDDTIPAKCPIATDGPEGNPFEVLEGHGTDSLRKLFQALFENPYNYPACRTILPKPAG